MHAKSEPDEPNNGRRRANTALVMMWIAIGSLAINVVGSTTFWFAMPEKLRTITDKVENQAARLNALETQASGQAATLARVDERTKSIQDDVRQLHQDFSFRASGNPTK